MGSSAPKTAKQKKVQACRVTKPEKAAASPLQIEKALERRASEAVLQNRHLSRVTGRFTLRTKGILCDRSDLCWVVLEPQSGALKLWSYPPEEDCFSLDPKDLTSFSQASAPSLSCFSGHASTRPPTAPFKNIDLEMLRDIDSNPHFRSIFLRFKGTSTWCLTAQSQETFAEWMQTLRCYALFVNPDAGTDACGPISPKKSSTSRGAARLGA